MRCFTASPIEIMPTSLPSSITGRWRMRRPGHTPGHQVLVVRLPKTGPVMLSGDMVHLQHSWNFRVAPAFNFDIQRSMATIDAMRAYAQQTGTQLWINHDMEQHAKIPKAPAYVQ